MNMKTNTIMLESSVMLIGMNPVVNSMLGMHMIVMINDLE